MKSIYSINNFLKNKIEQCEIVLQEKDSCDFFGRLNPKFKAASDTIEEAYTAMRMIKEFTDTKNRNRKVKL